MNLCATVATSQKHAIITLLLKKPRLLDPAELKNYRPVSNLSFISKVVESIIIRQLVEYLQLNNLMPPLHPLITLHTVCWRGFI